MEGPAPQPRTLPPRPWVILLVDDEPDILDSMQSLIEETLGGSRVLTAGSGRDGLALLDRERIDLVISDFKMPGMDGIKFLCEARRLHPTIPRVMLTAYASNEVADRAVHEAFVDSFLSKAGNPDQIVQSVAHLVDLVKRGGATGAS